MFTQAIVDVQYPVQIVADGFESLFYFSSWLNLAGYCGLVAPCDQGTRSYGGSPGLAARAGR